MNNTIPAIIFDNIEKNFGSLKVLKGITGEINRGEVVAVIGSSGCGKSTLLRCFNRLETIDNGRLIINGINLSRPTVNYNQLRQLRTQVGMVFQQFNLFPHLSVLENMTLAPRKVLGKTPKESAQLARLYLEKVGLHDKASAYPEQLSGGQKQRVAIARSLCMNPQIMLFDEPTSALDPELVGEVLQVMQQLAAEGMTMVVVTHEMQFAKEVAHQVIFLDKGIVTEKGSAYEVLTNPQSDRLRIFLSRLQVIRNS
ncbi:amino acid ABC transporter ATP-binding protein [Nostoc sp. UCD121]|uniref:amino acid ABC transporter ATP-binding protein n=1 Tax=unclassified Nostoc TaxID=2593658 RepID=UPI000DEC8A6C|nr:MULTISPECIES: amino acid ABC transporter ATP-binding protein [unclassified Nostoc]MBC1297419.1 amino acid ABC transporter ATP-binding protein [Nostoc sp. UCD122]MBD2511408.1 amino acid ABC transporter ATP-binding protein [Desmonostoc muscorum FACHB-395]MBC1219963.1 amino acid ABC transporter ATP-binding protein [Nostoc sp. UCD120]MBC1278459.1 amino acid ABC transporter ATP-binding protein [Nostoc sp. UCD121]QHG18849.1 ATP-binding cassette domain-containing protein [Nostoc sp. ATCC 53789]